MAMECERNAEMSDEERLREMLKHTAANVVETLGQALLETREVMPSNREEIVALLREAEGHCFVARVIEMGAGMTEDDLQAENAQLRKEVAALKATRWAGFTKHELGQMADVFLDAGGDWPDSLLYCEVEHEYGRREGSDEQ